MAIEYDIDAARTNDGSLFVLFRCSADEAPKLAAALRATYRGKGTPPQVVPAPEGGRFGYCCRLPDSRTGFERLWPRISLTILLAGDAPSPALKPTASAERARKQQGSAAAESPIAPLPETSAGPPPPAPLSTAIAPTPDRRASPAPGGRDSAQSTDNGHRSGAREAGPDEPDGPSPEPRVLAMRALLAAGDAAAVRDAIAADEPEAALRALRGRALIALSRDGEALADLRYAWAHDAYGDGIALPLARLSWQQGDFDAAARPYLQAWRENAGALTTQDLAALCELCWLGELGSLDEAEQLELLQRLCGDASPAERNTPVGRTTAERALQLARTLGQGNRLVLAYQHLLDVLVESRDGAGLASLLGELHDDYWRGRVDSAGRFEILDEVTEYQADYAGLRERLIVGYSDIIQRELAQAERSGEINPVLKDGYRALRRLERSAPLVGTVKQLLAGRRPEHSADELDESEPALNGRRIALVGGHERTREHVRRRLEGWGARVDEVPPPTNGRIAEREIFDKVHQSDLILLIVRYMGHDMSTAVGNLRRRALLRGQVLEIDSRGTSGICREISRWAQRA